MPPMDAPHSISRREPGLGPGATSTTSTQQRHPNPILPSAPNKADKPSQIQVAPFSNFQSNSQSSKTHNRNSPPVRRKPLPPSASPSTPKLPNISSGGKVIAVGVENEEENKQHSEYPATARAPLNQPLESNSPQLVVRDLDQFPRGLSPNVPQSPGFTPFHKLPPDQARDILLGLDTENYSPSTLSHARNSDPPTGSPVTARPPGPWGHQIQRSVTMPLKSGGPGQLQMPPSKQNGIITPQRQNSASNKISSFFGWKGSNGSNNYNPTSPIAETSPTTISDRSSIGGSPNGAHTHATSVSSHYTAGKPLPAAIDVPRANAPAAALFSGSSFPQAPPTPAMSIQVTEMEEELKELSEELANSIRREMELEEQIEKLQAEGPNALDKEKRTSDYFSDSGISSGRDPDGNDKEDELRRVKRQSAQEKASMKNSVSQKVQEERTKRKALEDHVKNLEAHIQTLELQAGGPDRVVELQNALEDSRRRLVEERRHKENYEDLIAALRVDLVQHKNERDNLKEEIVPQLKARLEGLEADAAEAQKLTYENTRMQQELQALRGGRFESIAEEGGPTTSKVGLSRSTSLMRGSKPSGSLSRSNSLSGKTDIRESRDALIERVKEIESQRDALHQALKSLLDRQKFQAREFEKRLSTVEQERDRALEASSPRRRGYEKEVKDLRYEIDQLRRRAEEALEQKLQCEKGLGGLKKDLDRAEQETSSLRQLLVENDVLVPDLSALPAAPHATSESLGRAYKELRAAQAMSIERLKELKDIELSPIDDKKTNETLDILLKTMSNAEAERDYAQKQADAYRARAESLQDAKDFQDGENVNLAKELKASAARAEALSTQVKRQLTANSGLRERLAEAIGKGEREQKQSATRINGLQSKLKGLEDRLMAAQQQSEDSIQLHEEDVRVIRKSSSSQLQRLKPPAQRLDVGGGNSLKPPRSPLSPRSPRLDKTTSGAGMSMQEAMRTEYLEQRVKELESALSDAEKEMGEVVQKMNMAQIEVMELQSARDEAMKKTRTLQNQIIAENENVGSLMKFLPR